MPDITLAEFTAPAEEAESEMDAAFTEEAPRGKFSARAMNSLVAAYRSIQELMGFEEGDFYPEFESNITEWPADFVRALSMVAQAAEDFGEPGAIDLSEINRDSDVALLTAKIEKLAANEEFAAFLSEDLGEAEDEEMGDEADDMDALFAERA